MRVVRTPRRQLIRLLRPDETPPVLNEEQLCALARDVNEHFAGVLERWAERYRKREAEVFARIDAGLSPWTEDQPVEQASTKESE